MSGLLSSRSLLHLGFALLLRTVVFSSDPAFAQADAGRAGDTMSAEDPRPLSAAQVALFETPHLQNVRQPETLDYEIVRGGDSGFTDRIAVHVRAIRADGSKDLSFDFMTGAHHQAYPELDSFRGNPLVMLVLERDVIEMKATLGLSAAYFRNRVRQSLVDQASVAEGPVTFAGPSGEMQTGPGRVVTVRPFEHDERMGRLPSVQKKSYVFVLADGVPGGIAELRIEMPGDAERQLPAFSERISFTGTDQ